MGNYYAAKCLKIVRNSAYNRRHNKRLTLAGMGQETSEKFVIA